jgi:4-hydroxy-tetrahydrodipicolinate reductase
MTRVAVIGAAGRMGQHALRAVEGAPSLEVGAALDASDHPDLGKEVAPGIELVCDISAALARCDVAIDFSTPASTMSLVAEATQKNVPLVIATTGFDEAQLERIRDAARRIPIAMAPNFSLGINVLLDLVAEAARRLEDYEIDILEMHHDQKTDAPSGTAIRLGQTAAAARGRDFDAVAVYHREGQTGSRAKGSIGMQTLRLGDSVGEHTVYLAGAGERLELSHRALSRDNFAAGAIRAAEWILDKDPGLYSMADVLSR